MNFDEYQKQALETKAYGAGDKIIYPTLGLGDEAGEVLGKVKKVLRDNDGIFTEAICKTIADEMGDVLWYLSALSDDINISLDTIAANNIAKVEDRRIRGVIHGSGDYR